MGVFDLQASKLTEQVGFDPATLMSPTIGTTMNGNINYQDSIRDVSHSMRIYKGKIFLLVSFDLWPGTVRLTQAFHRVEMKFVSALF